ncbi:MAG: hypothetical protein ABIG11_07920 [bacterium]
MAIKTWKNNAWVEEEETRHYVGACLLKVGGGREHRDLHLTGWWEAIPNTAVASWQVTGEID